MNNQEAIERIKDHIDIHKINEKNAVYISEALDMAISALEKQIPKKLQNIHRFRGREKCVGACPICGYVFCSDYGDYCGGCGQMIDWTDGE